MRKPSVFRLILLSSLLFGGSMSLADVCSKCSCGNVVVRILSSETLQHASTAVSAVDCHCRSCRRYHVAAFVSYLQLSKRDIQIEGADFIRTYDHTCDQMGRVQRWFCRHCYSKVATHVLPAANAGEQDDNNNINTTTATTDNNETILINMGTLDDDTIPTTLADTWKSHREQWCLSSKTVWTEAKPRWTRSFLPPLRTVDGGCACGSCQYRIKYQAPSELQHCYCQLCRQLSGSPFMTWVPVENSQLTWTTRATTNTNSATTTTITSSSPPALVRTTEHGQRHVCTQCGGVLTIVYDDQKGVTWPASGGFDDDTLVPSTEVMSLYLNRVLHICCIWKQSWYLLPDDGLPRIEYAS